MDDIENKLIQIGHSLPCLPDDGFCEQTIITPYTIVWYSDDLSLVF